MSMIVRFDCARALKQLFVEVDRNFSYNLVCIIVSMTTMHFENLIAKRLRISSNIFLPSSHYCILAWDFNDQE